MYKKQLLLSFTCLLVLFLFNACENGEREGKQFLTMNGGYQYKHHIQNEGPKPQPDEVAYFHFISKADDSLMMDGAEAGMVSKLPIPRPLPNPRKVVSPIMEAIKLMSIGDSMTLIVPLDSVPGGLPPGFGKFTNYYYDLVLIDIKSKEENDRFLKEEKEKHNGHQKEIDEFVKTVREDYKEGKLDDKITEKPSGLKYILHEEGKGSIPKKGDIVQIRYHAMLMNGDFYDSSFSKPYTTPIKVYSGEPFIVDGLDESLGYFKRGTKVTLFIPSDLAYGDLGNPGQIPPKSELVYYIELVK